MAGSIVMYIHVMYMHIYNVGHLLKQLTVPLPLRSRLKTASFFLNRVRCMNTLHECIGLVHFFFTVDHISMLCSMYMCIIIMRVYNIIGMYILSLLCSC